jgi:pantothenate kinase type III
MDWRLAMAWGAVGGVIVEAITLSRDILDWQAMRRDAVAAGKPASSVGFTPDLLGHLAAGFVRALLGSIAGGLGHWQISGPEVAAGIGAGAPELLFRQFAGVDRLDAAGTPVPEMPAGAQAGESGV